MRFRVERDELTEPCRGSLARSPPADHAAAGPGRVCCSRRGGPGLELSAFDYEVAAWGEINASVVEEGRALVSGRLLAEIVRSLPAAPVEFEHRAQRAC